MGGGRTPFTSPVFIFQNCKIKSGEVPYSWFICFRGPFEDPVQAGMGRAEDGREASLFSKGCSDHSALGQSDFPLLGLGSVEKKVTFSTFSFCCSRMSSAISNYRPACQL